MAKSIVIGQMAQFAEIEQVVNYTLIGQMPQLQSVVIGQMGKYAVFDQKAQLWSDWSNGPVCCGWPNSPSLLWLVRWPSVLWLVKWPNAVLIGQMAQSDVMWSGKLVNFNMLVNYPFKASHHNHNK